MSGNGTIRPNLVEAIRSSKLPARSPERTFGGQGCGALCVICGQRINTDELEYELEFAPGEDGKDPEEYHIHLGCFLAWESERRKLELKRSPEKRGTELSSEVAEIRLAEDEW
jgi:hypothetical protein